jgi:hypothetical protein
VCLRVQIGRKILLGNGLEAIRVASLPPPLHVPPVLCNVAPSLGNGLEAIHVTLWQRACLHTEHALRLCAKLSTKVTVINLVEEISRQPVVQAVAWLLLPIFS